MSDLPPVNIPRVARKARSAGASRAAVALVGIGGGVFLALASGRAARSAQLLSLPPLGATTAGAPVPFPQPATGTGVSAPINTTTAVAPAPIPVPAYPALTPDRTNESAAERARASLAAPALIVDLAQVRSAETLRATPIAFAENSASSTALTASPADAIAAAQQTTGPGVGSSSDAAVPGAPTAPISSGERDLNSNERFLNRAGDRGTDVARARRLPNQDTLVVQGTIFGAVMETALNSDLPGFARAVTTLDVLSFDGSKVMIPAGSHVIGEYNSGVAQGASRVFIVWTRLIRPDGVSIALASPAVDDLGRGGLAGKVNRHFLQRYGGAILLSVLTGGLNAVTQSLARGSTVVVSSSTEATSLAGQAAQSTQIPPTIKTKQGTNVRIFVARDLDFSDVGPAL